MSITLSRRKEDLYFEKLMTLEGYNGQNIETSSDFFTVTVLLFEQLGVTSAAFKGEIDDNLLLLADHASRIGYLKRINHRIEKCFQEFDAALLGLKIDVTLATALLCNKELDFPIEADFVTSHLGLYRMSLDGISNFVASRLQIEDPSFTQDEKFKVPLPVETSNEVNKTVEEFIGCFKGKWQGRERIMTEEEYNRLFGYTVYLVEIKQVPQDIKPFPKIGLSNKFIRKTFHLLHQRVEGKRVNENWIVFLHKVFRQLGNAEQSSTKSKFSEYEGDYFNDKEAITDY